MDEPGFYPLLLEDQVIYDDVFPWPVPADGAGSALSRVSHQLWGNDVGSWRAAPPSPGSSISAAPQVVSITVNEGIADPPDRNGQPQLTSWDTQRSEVHSIVVTFTSPVTATAADFRLRSMGINAETDPTVEVPLSDDQITAQGNQITLGFQNGQLPQGVIRLEVLGSVTSLDGEQLDGNGDGVPGDSLLVTGSADNGLYRLMADLNGDAAVTIFDFAVFAYWFGASVTAGDGPAYVDFNNDGSVTIFDFPLFSQGFGKQIVFLSPLAGAGALLAQDQPETIEPQDAAAPLDGQQRVFSRLGAGLEPSGRRLRLEEPLPRTQERAGADDLESILDDLAGDLSAVWQDGHD
jgi:hypothetical protein